MIIDVLKVLVPIGLAFFIGMAITPLLTDYLYRHRLWKKRAGKVDPSGQITPIFNQLHAHKEVGTPRLGGIIIWASVILTAGLLWLLSLVFPISLATKLNFLSRSQTWIPFGTLILGSLVGLIDDWLEISNNGDRNGGLSFKKRLLIVLLVGLAISWWFYAKLGMDAIFVPFGGEIIVGGWLIPIFLVIISALFSSGVIDGLDGLAGGVMSIIFGSYAAIAFFENQINLAAFCAAVAGGTLAFLWFNIPPARFYMSETGILGLTSTLATVAFLTDTVILLPLIALPLTITSLSVAIQLVSKKFRHGRKVFLVAPLHHHFEALGWSAPKVVMRYWVISVIAAVLGVIIALVSH